MRPWSPVARDVRNVAASGWADMLRLRGGKDWQRWLEDYMRNKGFKVFQVPRIEERPSAFSCHAGMQSGISPIADNTLAGPPA